MYYHALFHVLFTWPNDTLLNLTLQAPPRCDSGWAGLYKVLKGYNLQQGYGNANAVDGKVSYLC